MDIFRYNRDAWGQESLQGLNWDLLPLFAGAAALIIIAHLIYKLLGR